MTAVSARDDALATATNPGLPGWVRVGALARARTDQHGHARLAIGELRRTLHLTPQATSAALATARTRGYVDPTSSARCLVLPGHAGGPCPIRHRGDA